MLGGWFEGSLIASEPRSINYRFLNGSANWTLEHSQRWPEGPATCSLTVTPTLRAARMAGLHAALHTEFLAVVI